MKKQSPQIPQAAFWSYGISFLTLLCLFFISHSSYAQEEANNWYFGDSVGLNFSNGYPLPLHNSGMGRTAGSAVMSDSLTGELFFYTNSQQVWNRNHQLMPNGDSLKGSLTFKQNSLIIPIPSRPKQYYLFTLGASSEAEPPDSLSGVYGIAPPFFSDLSYSIINMELDNGLGDIVDSTKNILLADSLTQKMAIVPHRNGRDYWLIAHTMGDNCFQVFLIHEEGISEPQQQCIGTIHAPFSEGENFYQSRGLIKASPNNKMLVVTSFSFKPRPFDLFKFNNKTGNISEHIAIDKIGWQAGVSFSPDNNKLYIAALHESEFPVESNRSFLYQFDLRSYKKEPIRNSRLKIKVQENEYVANAQLELASDGRVYVSSNWEESAKDRHDLLVIKHPNRSGAAAGLSGIFFDFAKGRTTHSFPNFVQNIFNGLVAEDFPVIPEGTDPCAVENAIKLFPNPSNDFIQIKVSESCYQPYTLTIYNVVGQLINRFTIENQNSDFIEIRSFTSGLYFAEVKIGHRRIVRKFVKQ